VEAEFNSLEAKVAQFVSLCERLRAENVELKRELARATDAELQKIDGPNRLEGLLSDCPVEAEPHGEASRPSKSTCWAALIASPATLKARALMRTIASTAR
jgi:hypothetical protein